MMQINNLCVNIANRPILSNLSAQFPAEKATCVIGRNGCGKTTLLRTLVGLQQKSSGSITWRGNNMDTWNRKERARTVAYLPQNRPVPQIEAGLLIEHGRFPHEGFSKQLRAVDRTAIEQAISLTHTETYLNQKIPTLSGGERQRVYLAAALAQGAELLVLDEPTTYLDLQCQLDMMKLIRVLVTENKKTIVMVLHDLLQAFTFSDILCLITEKGCVASGTPATVAACDYIPKLFGCHVLEDSDSTALYSYRLATFH